jgi:hypothetical protein
LGAGVANTFMLPSLMSFKAADLVGTDTPMASVVAKLSTRLVSQ